MQRHACDERPPLGFATGQAGIAAATLAEGLLSGQFEVAFDDEPDREEAAAASTMPTTPRADFAMADARVVASQAVVAPLPLFGSSLITQPGAAYFRTIARIGAQVSEALAYAHTQGICHRDIKPSNLLLDARGMVWVADFGLAKAENSDNERLTYTGEIVGTLRDMAPERFNGWADARSDIYALGATLYEMLTLRPAFNDQDRLKLIDRISNGRVPRPRSIDPRIPNDLETIVLKAMAREASDRYVSARALAEDLERFLADRTILARGSSARERAWRWCRRNRALTALISLAATLTLLIAIVSTVAALVSIRQLDRTRLAERQTQLALGKSLLSEGAALQRTGLMGQRFKSLDRLAEAAIALGGDHEGRDRLPEIRQHAIAALGLTDLRVLWQRDRGDIYSVNVDPGLQRYAITERSGAVVVYRLDDHRELVRLRGPAQGGYWHAESRFSPDGELLVAVYVGASDRRNLLQVWHLARHELLATLQSRGDGAFYGGAFSPDSRRLLFCPPEGGIDIWDRSLRRVVRRLPLDFAPHYLAVDPEGRRLAVNNADAPPRVAILELESGRVLADWRSQVGNTNLTWSADGQLLAVGSFSGDSRVYIWNVPRRELSSVLQGHTAYIINARFAHAGHLLATASGDGTTRLWNAASGELLAMTQGNALEFAADDRRLAFSASRHFGVWEVASGEECRTLHPAMLGNRSDRKGASPVACGGFSPDGRLLATGDADGVQLWEASTGRKLAHLGQGSCGSVVFHPDGMSLITCGEHGLHRWPIRRDTQSGSDAVRIGPPQLLWETTAHEWNKATLLPDRQTVAMIDNAQARVVLVDLNHPHPVTSRAVILKSGENRRMTSIAVSGDGRWLAVGGWKEAGIRIWDLPRRRLERVLRPDDVITDMSFLVGFSPDGQWLVSRVGSDLGGWLDYWRTGTWEVGRRTQQEGAFAAPVFTGDGQLMALAMAPDQVLLADAATGREVVRLATLQSVTPMPLAFSPDGSQLIAGTNQKTALVWDLRRIRAYLASRGLDWHAPAYLPAPAPDSAPGSIRPPIRVCIVGQILEPQARHKTERAEMDHRLAVNSDDAEALLRRGWLSLTERRLSEAIADLVRLHQRHPAYPDVDRILGQIYQDEANPARALHFFGRALNRDPDDRETRLRRGLIAFALGRTQQAADDFVRILDANPASDTVRYHYARALNRLGRYRAALAETDVLLTRRPDDFALFQLRGAAYDALGQREPARLAWEKAQSHLSDNPPEVNRQARTIAAGAIEQRDPDRAVALARRAVALAPEESPYLNTLGVALYGIGRYSEAITALEQRASAGRREPDAFDFFFLAMAHHGLGHHGRALICFDRAMARCNRTDSLSPQQVKELAAVRAEAEAVLAGPLADLPADVFGPR